VVNVNIDDAVESEMMRAAATLARGRNQDARFEAGSHARLVAFGSASPGNESTVDVTSRAALISAVAAAFFTLLIQGALTFQKYRFDKGLMLGTTMAAVNWCEDVARRNNVPPSRLTLVLIATIAAAFTVALQQAARVLAAGVPQAITHS
jgi:hypothetical protein